MPNKIVNKEECSKFDWRFIGDIDFGRPSLGENTSIAIYRLMQYSMKHVLNSKFGKQEANKIIYEAGKTAGFAIFENILSEYKDLEWDDFLVKLEKLLISLKIGILKVEKADLNKFAFMLVVEEDIDCSGLPNIGETICNFDEGFIAAIFSAYWQKEFRAKEIDCWGNGDNVCRFGLNLMSNE